MTARGVILLDNEEGELDEDTVMMDALDCGASGTLNRRRACSPSTPSPTTAVRWPPLWREKGYVFVSAQVEMVPQNYVTLTDDGDKKNMEKLIDMLEDNDDVQNVYHNWDQE